MTNTGVSLKTMRLTLTWSQSCIQSRKVTLLWPETSRPSLGRFCGPASSSTGSSNQCSFSSSIHMCCRRRKPNPWFEVTTGWLGSSWSLRFSTTGRGFNRWVSTSCKDVSIVSQLALNSFIHIESWVWGYFIRQAWLNVGNQWKRVICPWRKIITQVTETHLIYKQQTGYERTYGRRPCLLVSLPAWLRFLSFFSPVSFLMCQ